MKEVLLLIITIVCSSMLANAQQSAQYSLYFLNKYSFNPAYAGADNSLSLTGAYRKQWVDLPGGPETQNFTGHLPLYFLGGGAGLKIENDKIGVQEHLSLSASYNYLIRLGNSDYLSVGFGAGIIQRTLDGQKLRAPEGNYIEPGFNHNDDLLPEGKERGLSPVFRAGLLLRIGKFELGAGADNLNEPAIDYGFSTKTDFRYKRIYYLHSEYDIAAGENFSITPSVFVKSDLIQTQIEATLKINFLENIFWGAWFRGYDSNSIDAVVLFGGFKLSRNFTLGYAYDLTLSALNEVSNGSHEVLLNYNLNKPIGEGRLPKIIYNPRFL